MSTYTAVTLGQKNQLNLVPEEQQAQRGKLWYESCDLTPIMNNVSPLRKKPYVK